MPLFYKLVSHKDNLSAIKKAILPYQFQKRELTKKSQPPNQPITHFMILFCIHLWVTFYFHKRAIASHFHTK